MGRTQLASLDAIAHYADSSPQSIALIEPEGPTLNYKELWAQIETLSCRLEEASIGSGERVAVLLPQGGQQVLAVTGVLNRHVAIPLQTKTTPKEVEASLHKLSVSALIAAPEFEAEADAAFEQGITVLVARKGESPKDWQIRVPASRHNSCNEPSEAVVLTITSATMGGFKIVPKTAANIDAGIASMCNWAKLTASDRLLLLIPQCFGVSVRCVQAQFCVGGAVIATGGFNSADYVSWINNLRPTWYICSPAVHQAAMEQLRCEPPSRSVTLRFIESCFAPLPEKLRQELEQILGVPMLLRYGASEAGDIASEFLSSGGHVPNRVGRSCGLEIGIMNSTGLLLPAGEEGEIAVRGPTVVSGYMDNPEATRAAFQDGWFRTGDSGRLDPDGNLYLTGRLKEIINRGGEKIIPAEVDAVIEAHPAVLEAVAFAVPHRTLGEDVACAVVLRGGNEPRVSAIELRRYAAQRLASFKVPHRIRFVDEIPRGEIGKPQRRLLTEKFGGAIADLPALLNSEDHRPALEIEDVYHQIRQIWARILNRDDVDLDEDFFDAGGDSLAAMTMLAEVDQRLGSKSTGYIASFIDEPTIRNLTTLAGRPEFPRPAFGAPSDMQIFPVRAGGSGPTFYCVPGDEDEGIYFRRLARHLQGIMDLAIVRPANTFYGPGLFTFERAGEEMAAIILREQPQGPYLVGGFCFGGIVASEAARQLALRNRDVRLVFFDVPMPGPYTLLGYFGRRLGRGLRERKTDGNEHTSPAIKHPETALLRATRFAMIPIRAARLLAHSVRTRWRRFVWYSMVPLRRWFVPIEHVHFFQWLMRKSQEDYFPFFRARTIDAPILHFLSSDGMGTTRGAGRDAMDTGLNASRLRWRDVACRGIEELFVPLDHSRILHESNLPGIVNRLMQWTGKNYRASLNAEVHK
ncbi:putative o-succinylbenzoate--CoA ligase [Candidatus Sulfotelmatomonas gaucii]|uniref:Putative o-succinylbenzoate--CoA ligase n=1 Tax=Candidatus Sulfuritelmatomonas gaucii TaxID=2043161 RepID=A0A2N9M9X4_9BACT|nr:putative o-succinylbenzoate--CoA ligase [Candidatus Sulfotelmatomonas gaucii]